jgi:DnaJ family protein C protein 11
LENLDDEEEDDADQETEGVIDVTVVLQAMVNESRLTIPSGHSKVTVGVFKTRLGSERVELGLTALAFFTVDEHLWLL